MKQLAMHNTHQPPFPLTLAPTIQLHSNGKYKDGSKVLILDTFDWKLCRYEFSRFSLLLNLLCNISIHLSFGNFCKLCPRSVATCRLRRQHALTILVWLHFFVYLYFQHRSGSTATCRLCRPHTHCDARWWVCIHRPATHWSILEHTATHYNALQHVTIHWNTWQQTAPHCTTL